MKPEERRDFAETAYKRLYWQGFKGRFGLFSWPTQWTETDIVTMVLTADGRTNYNDSEMKAYASAGALRTLLGRLNDDGYSVNLLAHSMGNVVASEALRQEALSPNRRVIAHTYVAAQAAASAGAYDPNVAAIPANLLHANYAIAGKDYEPIRSPTPDVYSSFPVTVNPSGTPKVAAYFEDIGLATGKMYNFFHPRDGAVGEDKAWPLNQALKPDNINRAVDVYTSYFPVDGQFAPFGYSYQNGAWSESYSTLNPDGSVQSLWTKPLDLSQPYDAYAVMAYGAESKTKGLGATAGVGFGFTTAGEVDVQTAFGPFGSPDNFSASRDDHSGQFNLDNMRRHKFWNIVMKRFGITPMRDQTPDLGERP